MLPATEALRLILKHASVLDHETVLLSKAGGRILARDLKAPDSLPPFDNSAMDGYAVRAADLKAASAKNPVELTVRGVVRAGAGARAKLKAGEAARIMTGAPLPRGADSVVMQERVLPGAPGRVKMTQPAKAGDHIRARGEDVKAGSLLLKKSIPLRPYEIALLAAQGLTKIPVIRRPTVAILATGDELVACSRQSLAHGKIRNSNGPAMLAALSRWDIPAVDLGIIKDDPKKLQTALRSALSQADVILVSGGVSVGDFDYTKAAFPKAGLREIFWRVAVKPGKPLLFGVSKRRPTKLVFGLPGNPLAVLVCLEEFVRPALEKLQGHAPKHASYHLLGKTVNDYPKPKDRQQYLFCQAKRGPEGYDLRIIRPQGSAMLGMAAQANALAIAPLGVARVRQGESLPFRWLK